jgi:hypothetical protein
VALSCLPLGFLHPKLAIESDIVVLINDRES